MTGHAVKIESDRSSARSPAQRHLIVFRTPAPWPGSKGSAQVGQDLAFGPVDGETPAVGKIHCGRACPKGTRHPRHRGRGGQDAFRDQSNPHNDERGVDIAIPAKTIPEPLITIAPKANRSTIARTTPSVTAKMVTATKSSRLVRLLRDHALRSLSFDMCTRSHLSAV